MNRLQTILLLAASLLSPRASLAANVYMYIGPTGQSLYGRVEETAGSFVAFALVEGTGGAKGKYYATEANIVSAGLDTASTGEGFIVTVHSGATPSTTAEDPISGNARLKWTGSTEDVSSGSSGSTLTDSDFENVPTTRTWKLITNSSNELVGDKTLVLDNDTGEKTFAIDFAVDLSANGKINTVGAVAIATGTADGVTFGTSGRERNLAKVRITGVTAGTYTLTCKVTDGEGNPHTGNVTLKVVE